MNLRNELISHFSRVRVLTDDLDRIAFASDASFYQLIPEAVVRPRNIDDVRKLFATCHRHGQHLTFRTAGTSLSGQAITDGILVDLSRDWREAKVLDNGTKIALEPAVIGAHANIFLKKHGRKIGPDPASIQACMIGGIVANNASGMCCGVTNNAYHTLDSMVFVLADGTTVDTSESDANEKLRKESPHTFDGVLALREKVLRNPALVERIRSKYKIKNTMGYSLNAFLDFEKPVDILAHLLVGSEGTLAFIAKVVMRTVVEPQFKQTGLLLFDTVEAACSAISFLKEQNAYCVELMDKASLEAIAYAHEVKEMAPFLKSESMALLVEFASSQESEWSEGRVLTVLKQTNPTRLQIAKNEKERAALWKLRKGLFPSVGAARKLGTTVLIEDVAVPLEHLASCIQTLRELFTRHCFEDAIIFGHGKDGNLHFVVSQSFNSAHDVKRYDDLIAELSQTLTRKFSASLKAEHGTGRNMAPFVEMEWGSEAYCIMLELKKLLDPGNILNPGVIINHSPKAHVEFLKPLPTVNPIVDKCIECGFCEPRCPSRDYTMSPRQRIAVSRAVVRQTAGELAALSFQKDLKHALVDTCAADGLCATACPVGIDTGQFVKSLREENLGAGTRAVATLAARNFSLVEAGTRVALKTLKWFQFVGLERLFNTFAKPIRTATRLPIPILHRRFLKPATPSTKLQTSNISAAQFVHFESCLSRNLCDGVNQTSVSATLSKICNKAKIGTVSCGKGMCCGMPFESKGLTHQRDELATKVVDELWRKTGGGQLPVVIDNSSCTYAIKQYQGFLRQGSLEKFKNLTIIDSIEFLHDHVLPNMNAVPVKDEVLVHPVCSVVKMGLEEKLLSVAKQCAEGASVPEFAGCCGQAGDRGFMFPELTKAATTREAAEIAQSPASRCYSTNSLCEAALAKASGKDFSSLVYLVERSLGD